MSKAVLLHFKKSLAFKIRGDTNTDGNLSIIIVLTISSIAYFPNPIYTLLKQEPHVND